MSFFSKFKRFDVHMKAIDGVHQRTILGAVLTTFSIVFVIFLVVTEVNFYLEKHVEDHLVTDFRGNQEVVVIDYDIQFFDMKCKNINFISEVTRGTVHVHEPDYIRKIDEKGCHVVGNITTDKIGGNFRFDFRPQPDDLPEERIFSISHQVNYLYFHPSAPKIEFEGISTNTLRNHTSKAPNGAGIHQYVIQVVSTEHKPLQGESLFMNEYSVTERHVDEDQFDMVESIGGHSARDFMGVMFSYDFTPVNI